MQDRLAIRPWARILFFSILMISGLASCRPISTTTPTADPATASAVTPQPSESALPTPSAGISTLTLWLPPAFRPDKTSPGGEILQSRIEAFEELHLGLDVLVRIKAPTGSGGLRDSLAAAAAAAPGALPDIVALDQSNLRAAAIKSLVHPLDGGLPAGTWDAYYPFAKSMATIDDLHFGLPFAGDAIVLANTLVPSAQPQRWEEILTWTSPMVLPLADSRSLFLFFGYYAAGGTPMISIADTIIDPKPLELELKWLLDLHAGEVLSARSLQIDSFETAFRGIENFGESAVTMYSIVSAADDYFPGYLPTPDGEKFSLATGWSWAVATPDPVRQAKAMELILWLADPQFLAEWSRTQGVIPPSSDALEFWPSGSRKALAAGILDRALAFPDDEITAFVGPVFTKAIRRVLMDDVLPADSAQEAAKAIHP
jgi:ABC-type glycerol-3-phosphate transport system substrate-binding protein